MNMCPNPKFNFFEQFCSQFQGLVIMVNMELPFNFVY